VGAGHHQPQRGQYHHRRQVRKNSLKPKNIVTFFKGTVARDFRLSVFFINQYHICLWLTG
jgi:hypothetical protein